MRLLKLKDDLLNELVSAGVNATRIETNTKKLAEKLDTTEDMVLAILDYFVRQNLCTIAQYYIGGNIDIVLNAEAYDMVDRGGFLAQEEILNAKLEKLAFEIEQLKPNNFDKATKISSLVSDIFSVIGFTINI